MAKVSMAYYLSLDHFSDITYHSKMVYIIITIEYFVYNHPQQFEYN